VGKPQEAADCYRAAAQDRPGFSDALLNLGHALKDSGQEEEARQAWSKAVEADPELAGKYFQ
jgi:tetratricopeptide (TPR) repeat protein